MKKYAIKLEITNTINDDKTVHWYFCETEEEKKTWIDDHIQDKIRWNYHTSGAMSIRYYDFMEYDTNNILSLNLSELRDMTVLDFLNLVKNLL